MMDKKKFDEAREIFYKASQRLVERFYAIMIGVDWDTLIFYDTVRKVKEKYDNKENTTTA